MIELDKIYNEDCLEDRKREWLRIMADAKPMPSSGRWKPKEKKQLYTRKPKTD